MTVFRPFQKVSVIVLAGFLLFSAPSPAVTQQKTATTQQTTIEEPPPPAFGYDIFRAAAEAVTEGPIDENFILSPGDKIIIKVWGQLTLNYTLDVSEEGYIELETENARIFTNGVSLKELRRLVTEKLAESYASYINTRNPAQSTAFVDVRLGQVRKVMAYVLGEVKNQGQYTVGAGAATLLNILNQAGGILEKGSLREIRIRRMDKPEPDVIDLYEFLVTGKIDVKKIQIRQGDYIQVPLKAKSILLKGEVKRPAIYEAVGNEGIKQVLGFAGGLTANAYLNRVQVRRFEVNRGERFLDLDIESIMADPKKDFALIDGDEITIYPNILVRRRMVEIKGNGVTRPGTYEFASGMTVRNLIEKAGGLKEYIYLDRADLVRTEADFSKRLLTFPLKDLFREDKPGHFVYSGKEDADLKLQEMDEITLYSKFEMKGGDKSVTLEGHVKEPGTYVLAENTTLYDLIFAKGGFQDEAFKKKAYLNLGHIFRKTPGELDTKILSFNLGRLLTGDQKESVKLESEDRITIYSFETLSAQKPYVTVEGLVKRPGNYFMSEGLTVEDLVLIAGGLTPDAFRVEAVVGRTARKIVDEAAEGAKAEAPMALTLITALPQDFAALPKEKRTPLEVFDKVVIRHLAGWEPQDTVTIGGEVQYPGSYSLESKAERVSTLIKKAGGFKREAFAAGATLMRRKNITSMTAIPDVELKPVAVDLEKALAQAGTEADFLLKHGDVIVIPTNPGVVEITGAVRQPGFVQFRERAGAEDYIRNAGGYLPEAEKRDVTVYLPNRTAQKKGTGLFGRKPEVKAGSVIEVPFKEILKDKSLGVISINGAVKFPMSIKYRAGRKLDYYLGICGGFKDDADPGKIVVQLPDGTTFDSQEIAPFNPVIPAGSSVEIPFKEAQVERKAADFVLVKGAVKFPLAVKVKDGQRLEYYVQLCGGYADNADPGKIVIRKQDGSLMQNRDVAPFNPVVEAGSTVEVPFKEIKIETDYVVVRGAVKSPVSVRFKEGERLDYYIGICGGYGADADQEKLIIRLPDGSSLQSKDIASQNPMIAAGSTIEVPDKTGKIPNIRKDVEDKGAEVKQ